MRINDVEKITGLTQKAIRLYESRGLISVSREENGYRNYTEADIDVLKRIMLYRSIGISLSDIKLCLFGVLSVDEMIEKRKGEILKESGKNSESYRVCQSILKNGEWDSQGIGQAFTEGEEAQTRVHGSLSVGIDVGTTTVSATVYDIDNCAQIESYSIPHNSYVCQGERVEQSVHAILEKAKRLLYHIIDTYGKIVSIGITGQMHGIVYVNSEGEAVSPLINWQDKRGDTALKDGKSACQKIFEITGEKISTGYGIATHYCNMLNGEVPRDATGFCSIMDLFAMCICKTKRAVTHASVGASLGLFDVKRGCFMEDKLSLLGIEKSFLPAVTGESTVIGKCEGIPVSVPIGDNQASFLGSVRDNESSIFINVGTGSQVSAVSDYMEAGGDIELRPFIEGKYLLCGSALCGGYAYAMLEGFFRSYAKSMGLPEESQYKTMNRLAKEAYDRGERGLLVDTSFLGKRSEPSIKGSITGIDHVSFTPSALTVGVLRGMCAELYGLYKLFPRKMECAVASGGAIKKNDTLKVLMSEAFEMPVRLSAENEEAAIGVALFSAFASGKIKYSNGFFEHIKYMED